MTSEELAAIKARAEAATPGPWTPDAERPEKHTITLRRGDGMVLGDVWKWTNVLADAEFIAHARTDVPALVEEVERLREALTVLVRQSCPSCSADDIAEKMLRGELLPDELRELYLT